MSVGLAEEADLDRNSKTTVPNSVLVGNTKNDKLSAYAPTAPAESSAPLLPGAEAPVTVVDAPEKDLNAAAAVAPPELEWVDNVDSKFTISGSLWDVSNFDDGIGMRA